MIWRVVATQTGQYNQLMRNVGEVFDLLLYADGTYPPAIKYTPKKDKDGKVIIDEYDEEIIKDKAGVVQHLHFSPDVGSKMIKTGPSRGETVRIGWMKRVPDKTPLGQYPVDPDRLTCDVDFWSKNVQLPAAFQVVPPANRRAPEDHRRNHAPILEFLPPPEVEEA